MQRLVFWMMVASFLLAGSQPVCGETTKRPIEIDDYFTLANISNCRVSPDDRHVAYIESRWDVPHKDRFSEIWLLDLATKARQRLTFDPASDSNLRWSPDGEFLYFICSKASDDVDEEVKKSKRQLWRICKDGSDLQQLTRIKKGVQRFEIGARGQGLYYVTTNEKTHGDWSELRKEYKDLIYGHGVTTFSEVWRLDLISWHDKQLLADERVIVDLDISPDETRVALITRPDNELITNEGWSTVDVYDAAADSVWTVTPDGWRDNHPSPYGWLDSVRWSPDGKALAFVVSFDGFPTEVYSVIWRQGVPVLQKVKRPSEIHVEDWAVQWRPDSRDLGIIGQSGAYRHVYAIRDVGGSETFDRLTPANRVASGFSFGDGVTVITQAGPDYPEDIFRLTKPGQVERLTEINPQIEDWQLPEISVVRWAGANGDTVEGILEIPYGHDGSPLPLIVHIHGGPTAATLQRFQFWGGGRTYLPAKGYAVFSPNYRGSTGYGDDFLVELVGRENDIEVTDILTGIDALIKRGVADLSWIGVMGWSNGGYLTNALITRRHFQAASSGAGVLDMVIQWSIEDTPGHVINYMQGLPWTKYEAYRAASPIYDLDNVTTPTIIHCGEGDERVPAAHAKALYRALHHYLGVDVELVLYPDTGHGLRTYDQRKARMEWDAAWFDKYIMTPYLEGK